MNTIPRLPMRFRQGEVLTADKLNALLDWMEAVQKLLPGLRVSTGEGLTYSRGSTGTVISLGRGFARGSARGGYVHPFKIGATVSEGKLTITVAPGCVKIARLASVWSDESASPGAPIERVKEIDVSEAADTQEVWLVAFYRAETDDEGVETVTCEAYGIGIGYGDAAGTDAQEHAKELGFSPPDTSKTIGIRLGTVEPGGAVKQNWRSDAVFPER